MANQYDTNLKLQAIADAIGNSGSSGLISALEDIADAVAGGGGGGSSTAGLVSDNFSETDTYDLGDYCIHNNTLYVCINAITTPGAWDLSDWQATNAGIQLSSLNSALKQYIEINLKGTNITSQDVAGFYAQIEITNLLPAGARPYSVVCMGSYDGGLSYGLAKLGNNWFLTLASSRSYTVSSVRPVFIYYFK